MNEQEQAVCDKLLDEIANSDSPSKSLAIGQYKTFLEAVSLRVSIKLAINRDNEPSNSS